MTWRTVAKTMQVRLLPVVLLAACSHAPEAEDPAVVLVPAAELETSVAQLPPGTHLSMGQPDEPTLRAAAKAGYTAVIDMRTAGEDRGFDEAQAVDKLGLRYVTLPIGALEDINYANAASLDRAMNELDGPVLLHCASGNRVGALLALRASAAGASDEEALTIGRQAGMTVLEDTVKKRLAEKR